MALTADADAIATAAGAGAAGAAGAASVLAGSIDFEPKRISHTASSALFKRSALVGSRRAC